jgi:hypothetical protein
MVTNTLLDLFADRLDEGQHEFARIIKTLVAGTDPHLFQLLNVENDAIFLEPLLFAHFNMPGSPVSLSQILFGYIDDDLKPASIDVFADEDGIIYLPNVGYFETKSDNRILQLSWNAREKSYQLQEDHQWIDFDFRPVRRIKDTAIELCQFKPPLLGHLFRDADNNNIEIEVENITRRQTHNLNRAICLIRSCYPKYFEAILRVTRTILIYRSSWPYSFASVSAHGIAFLNARDDSSDVFFLEDLIHQCGHIIFSAVTQEKQEYFQVDPETPLSRFTHDEEDTSPVYGAFHGLFTQANITRCLFDCYQTNIFSGKQLHELLGRLSDDVKRFRSALSLLAHREIYTELGWLVFHEFKRTYEELYRDCQPLVSAFDTSNQPYIFCYHKFQELNPLPRMEEVLMNIRRAQS